MVSYYKIPHLIKVYEALGTLADENRVEMVNPELIKIYSSSRNKFYNVYMRVEHNGISSYANDNGTYYVGYFGYPIVVFLLINNILKYDKDFAKELKGIMWKDLNMRYNRAPKGKTPDYDFEGVIKEVNSTLSKGALVYINELYDKIKEMNIIKTPRSELIKLGVEIEPPKAY